MEVQGVGEKTGNLFDYKYFFDNCIAGNLSRLVYEVKPNTSYTLSTSVPTGGGYASVFLSSGVVETVTTDTDGVSMGNPRTVTADENGKITITLRTVSVVSEAIELHEAEFASGQYWVMLLEGSHTAESIPQYEPYGYKAPVEVGGINLFDAKDGNGSAWTYANVDDDGWITAEYDNTQKNNSSVFQMGVHDSRLVKENTAYTVRYEIKVINGCALQNSVSAGGAYVPQIRYNLNCTSAGVYVLNVTSSSDFAGVTHLTLLNFVAAAQSVATVTFRASIYKGAYTADTMPAYEPYHEPQTVNVYTDKPLYAVGDVGDTITLDFDAKTATRTERVGIRTLDGTENWIGSYALTDSTDRYINTSFYDGYSQTRGFSDRLLKIANAIWAYNGVEGFTFNGAQLHLSFLNTNLGVTAEDDNKTRTQKFKTFLSTHPTTVYGPLATPTTTDISDLQNWDAMPSTWRGTVVISADTTIQPSSMAAQYYATKKED